MKLTRNDQNQELGGVDTSSRDDAPKRKLNPKFLGMLVGAFIGVIISITLSYVIYDIQVVQSRNHQIQEYTRQKAKLTADRVQAHFKSVLDKSDFFASQTLLRDAIVSNDVAAIEQAKRTINRQIKGVESVNIFKTGSAKIDSEHFPPIRFSELELIHSAEKGKPSDIEAVKVDKEWLLNVVVPARADASSETEGVLWVTTNLSDVIPLLQQDNEAFGKVSLFQKFSKRSRPLVASVGSSDLDEQAVSTIGDSHWEVQFNASSAMYSLTHIDIVYVFILIFVVVLCGVGMCTYSGFYIGRNIAIKANHKKMENRMRAATGQGSGDEYIDPMYQAKSILDVDINKGDESLLGMDDDDDGDGESLSLDDDVFDIEESAVTEVESDFPSEVFRAYDIRGLADKQINKEFALTLGRALGSELIENHENTLVVARDARTHSPQITEWLIRGILSTGCNVLNIGTVPTPLMYFTIETMEEVSSGVMVTASHNDAEYNGFKMVMNHVTRSEDDIRQLRRRMTEKKFSQGQGQEHHHDIVASYIDTIFSDVALAGEMSVVIDAGNGVAGKVAPKLFEELGCRVTPLYCDLDGTFPNHSPDPSVEENLQDLIAKVQDVQADIGVALDGDGDRLTIVSPSGKVYWADRLLMLFSKDILSRSPGADVVFDVKSTRHLNSCIASNGGRPIMWKTGHSLMKQKMQETSAVVGAEYSGHIFIKDRWFGFDDGMYAAARLLEILSLQGEDVDMAFEEFPESVSTNEYRIKVDESRKFDLIDQLKEKANFGEGRLTVLDGIRADFSYGWGLVRASNTGAELTMRFEADDDESIHKLKAMFVRELRAIDSSIEVNWDQ